MHPHDKLLPWRLLPLAVAAVLVLFAAQPGCLAPDGTLDVPATVDELTLTAADLTDLATVADASGKAGTAKALRDTAEALQTAAAALQAGNGTGDAWDALDLALKQLEALAVANEDGDLLLGITAAKIVVRRIKAGVAEPEPAG